MCGDIDKNEKSNSKRIAGGKITRASLYPWHTIIAYLGDYKCGSSVINNLYVLTAAHCYNVNITI